MDISRIQVEGGFLDGLDIKFLPGLNVIIGARGTGKTSIIELIRYALSAKNLTSDSKTRSLDHARAVLDGGEVCVTIADLIDDITVSRSATEESPRSDYSYISPIILSQTEIETVGLSESGRLSLIDGFIADRNHYKSEQASIVTSIKSFYKEIVALEGEIAGLGEGVEQFDNIKNTIIRLEKEQAQYHGTSSNIHSQQIELSKVSNQISNLSVQEEVAVRFGESVERWFRKLEEDLFEDFGLEEWDNAQGEDPLSELRIDYTKTIGQLDGALTSFKKMKEAASNKIEKIRVAKIELEKESRALRSELEKNAEGAGALARQISALKSNTAQIQSRQKVLNDRKNRLLSLREKRNEKLDELDDLREKKSSLRQEVISRINKALSPHIRIELDQSAQFVEYTRGISNALRGSGMKYNELASNISAKISPRELMDLVDNYDVDSLSEITGIPKDRASRLLNNLFDAGIADIITSEIEDSVRLSLLDGTTYKDVTSLSAGQRCTVILSIVLQHHERTLIIDQPEDHLDNAFIASTVIKALQKRKDGGQVILSTHNANIPVLGQADLIIELTSDGRNGFVQVCKPLSDSDAVEAITNVMEGGKEAFNTRAAFYESHKSQ